MTDEELRTKIISFLETQSHLEDWPSGRVRVGDFIEERIPSIADKILNLIKEAGCVKLDQNQNLPVIPHVDKDGIAIWSSKQIKEAQQAMIKVGWRKVILEDKNGKGL